MKKIILLIFITLFSNSILVAQEDTNKISPLVMEGATLPGVNIKLYDSSVFNTNKLSAKNLLLVLFNPGCGHCQDFTKDLIANRHTTFKDFEIVLMTGEPSFPYIADFVKAINYKKEDNLYIGADLDKITFELFTYQGLPQVMCYNNNLQLLKIYSKDIKISNILNHYPGLENIKPIELPKTNARERRNRKQTN